MLLRVVTVSCSPGQELNGISFALRREESRDHIKSELTCWVTRSLLADIVYFPFVSLSLYVTCTFCASGIREFKNDVYSERQTANGENYL